MGEPRQRVHSGVVVDLKLLRLAVVGGVLRIVRVEEALLRRACGQLDLRLILDEEPNGTTRDVAPLPGAVRAHGLRER